MFGWSKKKSSSSGAENLAALFNNAGASGGIENFANMLNNMGGDGGTKLGILFSHLDSRGTGNYTAFLNNATPEESKSFSEWIEATREAEIIGFCNFLNNPNTSDASKITLAILKYIGLSNARQDKPQAKDGASPNRDARSAAVVPAPTSDSEMLRFQCPQCSKKLKAGIHAAGKKATCHQCGFKMIVPGALPAQSPAIAPPDELTKALRDLHDADFDVRIDALAKLRELKRPDAVEPLLKLLQDRDGRIRQESAYTLESLGDPRAVMPLIAALVDLDGDVRLKVARALGVLKDERAIDPLCVHLRDPDQIVRFFAAQALERIGNPSALPSLRKALEQTTHEEARRGMEDAITTLQPKAPAPPPPAPPLVSGREAAKRFNDMSNVADKALAERNLRAAIDADPRWAIPYCNLGRLCFEQGRIAEARQCFTKACELARSRSNPGDDLVFEQSQLFLRTVK